MIGIPSLKIISLMGKPHHWIFSSLRILVSGANYFLFNMVATERSGYMAR